MTEEKKQITWGELKQVIDESEVQDSDVIEVFRVEDWMEPRPDDIYIYRNKLNDGKWYANVQVGIPIFERED